MSFVHHSQQTGTGEGISIDSRRRQGGEALGELIRWSAARRLVLCKPPLRVTPVLNNRNAETK